MRIEGNRILLRELGNDDWLAVHDVANHPQVYRYQPWGPSSPEETRTYVEQALRAAKQQPRTAYTLAAELRATGRLVGYGFLAVRSERFRAGEIGYFLHPEYWGRGMGTEVASLLVRTGFEAVRLHRIYATVDPRNLASARVLQKTGLTHEGRLRHTMLIRDGWRDADLYSVLEQEWQERHLPAQ